MKISRTDVGESGGAGFGNIFTDHLFTQCYDQ